MPGTGELLSDRRASRVFLLGCLAVTVGVLLHLPMVRMAQASGHRLVGMAVDTAMVAGMLLIIGGIVVAAYGLLARADADRPVGAYDIVIAAPEDVPLGRAHWTLLLVLTIALIIDVMKPASLGFTIPGMITEYGVSRARVSLVPFSALLGTVVGSVAWGVIADTYGRKASIMLSAVVFIGTSICGAMPSLAWNIGMCFLMGAAAGGMLPVAYALLAEMMPTRHRGWSLVLVGGLGAAGGYFAASGVSALLQPVYGWRILWLLNLPTGLILVLLGGLIPESAKFLLLRGRTAEARRVMQRFGAVIRQPATVIGATAVPDADVPAKDRLFVTTAALSIAALTWGLVNFGLLLWLPADLVAKGYSVGVSSRLLARSALIACPTVIIAAMLYSRWSTRWSLVLAIAVMILGLIGVLRLEAAGSGSPVWPVALLIVGSNGLIAMLLPYAAESFALRVRGRATGWIAACTKGGGLIAQTLSILALVPSPQTVATLILGLAAVALVLVTRFGRETRARDLRRLEPGITGRGNQQYTSSP